MSDQEENEDGQGVITAFPSQEWDWLEVPAIICRISAGAARCVGQGLDALAFELQTAATWRRETRVEWRFEEREERTRTSMAKALDAGNLDWKPEDLT